MKKIGIITFHNSNNCGSMLESYAIQKNIEKLGYQAEIIDFSTPGQIELYRTFFKNNSPKNIIKNIILFPFRKKINFNNTQYQKFKQKFFNLSKSFSSSKGLGSLKYDAVVAGSDQIWNPTIEDYDDAYYINWFSGKKIAYAPSFGAKNPQEYDKKNLSKYSKFMNNLDFISVRENNGSKWIKEISGRNAPVVLDPTLLLSRNEYKPLERKDILNLPEKYIFFYCPSFQSDISDFTKKLSKKYNLPVIAWSAKSFYLKNIKRFGFKLPDYEDPSTYLSLIKNAELILTTSFHGAIFSSIYQKKFFVLKNGGMYGTDDRVITMVNKLGLEKHLISYEFNPNYNYLAEPNYQIYHKKLKVEKAKSLDFLKSSLN